MYVFKVRSEERKVINIWGRIKWGREGIRQARKRIWRQLKLRIICKILRKPNAMEAS